MHGTKKQRQRDHYYTYKHTHIVTFPNNITLIIVITYLLCYTVSNNVNAFQSWKNE